MKTLKKIRAVFTWALLIFVICLLIEEWWNIPYYVRSYTDYFTPDKINTWHMVMRVSKDSTSLLVQPIDTTMRTDFSGKPYIQAGFPISSFYTQRWIRPDKKHGFTKLGRGDVILVTKDSVRLIVFYELVK